MSVGIGRIPASAASVPTTGSTPPMTVSIDTRYRLSRLLGVGGYSRVYLAEDVVLGRAVAVKQLAAESTDPRHRERMLTESRLLASLTHPSLVSLFDADLSADPPYLVMEFIDGPTLREVIGSGPMQPRRLRRLAVQLADALALVHAHSIVHRDIKPSNVLLRPGVSRAEPWMATLADFGIASLVDTARLTAAGTVVGTAAYLSPEQVRGAPPAPSADIYSLGLVLLEALTGRPAFEATTPHEALAARLMAPPVIPTDLEPFWRGLIAAMTRADPAARPTAGEVRETIAGRRPPHPTPPAVTRDVARTTQPTAPRAAHATTVDASRTAHRRIAVIAALILVALAIAAGVVVTLAGAVPSADPPFAGLPQPLQDDLSRLWREVGP